MIAPIVKNVVEIFVQIDDFCKQFSGDTDHRVLPNPDRKRKTKCCLTASEIMTIVVLFHIGKHRTFKDFYTFLCVYHKVDFPSLPSYNRFIELQQAVLMPLFVLVHFNRGAETAHYYIDSTTLDVCENPRISSHKVFKGLAALGKSSTGWFFGFKLHVVFNDQGEIMKFSLTAGNKDDRSVVLKMMKGLDGWLFGDRGYISQRLKEELKEIGVLLITRNRKNMQPANQTPHERFYLSKRPLVETAFGQMKNCCQIEHTRHRSVINFLVNLFSGLIAYALVVNKPAVKQNCLQPLGALTSN